MLTRDLALYERKANLYLEKCAVAAKDTNENDTAGDVTTVLNGDPLDFWIKQVIKLLFVS